MLTSGGESITIELLCMEEVFENHNPFPLGTNSSSIVREHRLKIKMVQSYTEIQTLSCDFSYKYLEILSWSKKFAEG